VDAPTFRLSTRGPEVFIAGNARGEDGISWDPRAAVLREILTESNFSMGQTMALTLATHRADPLGYVSLLWNKTAAFFNGYEVPNNVNFYLNRSHLTTLRVGIVSMTFLGPAALLGLLLALPRRRRLAVPYLLLGALVGSVVALYILARFRLQALPLLAFFAGYAVDWSAEACARRRWAPLALAAMAFALLVTWSWPPTSAFTDLNKNAAIMLMHIKTGNFTQARRYRELQAEAIATMDPDTLDDSLEWKLAAIEAAFVAFDAASAQPEGSAGHHMRLADGYSALLPASKRGEKIELSNRAIDNYQRALELEPDRIGIHHGLGTVYGRNDDSHRALSEFRAELALHPEHGPSHRDAGLILFAWNDLLRALVHFDYAIIAGNGDARVMACAARVHIDKTFRDDLLPSGLPAYDEALGWVRADAALRLDSEDPLVQEHAATVYYARGRSLDDPAWIQKAIDLLVRLREQQPWREAFITNRIEIFGAALESEGPVTAEDAPLDVSPER
jgi:tetratricopeptide (TPR) repeat protein